MGGHSHFAVDAMGNVIPCVFPPRFVRQHHDRGPFPPSSGACGKRSPGPAAGAVPRPSWPLPSAMRPITADHSLYLCLHGAGMAASLSGLAESRSTLRPHLKTDSLQSRTAWRGARGWPGRCPGSRRPPGATLAEASTRRMLQLLDAVDRTGSPIFVAGSPAGPGIPNPSGPIRSVRERMTALSTALLSSRTLPGQA